MRSRRGRRRRADGPRAARVAGLGRRGVVRRPCDWSRRWGGSAAGRGRRSRARAISGRRQVASSKVVATGSLWIPSLRAREQLVPGAEAGTLPINHERQLCRARGRRAVRVTSHGRQQLLAGDGGGAARIAASAAHDGQRLVDQGRVTGAGSAVAAGAKQRGLEQDPHLGQLGRQLHLRLDLLQQGAAHAAEAVAPGLDGIAMPDVAVEPDAAGPAIVLDQRHRRFPPTASRPAAMLHPQQQRRVQQVMPVGVDVGRDQQVVADHPLDGVTSPVELGLDPLDDDAATRADRVRGRFAGRGAPAVSLRRGGRSGCAVIGGCALLRTKRA